jgi:hypothetical protein
LTRLAVPSRMRFCLVGGIAENFSFPMSMLVERIFEAYIG